MALGVGENNLALLHQLRVGKPVFTTKGDVFFPDTRSGLGERSDAGRRCRDLSVLREI
jgi:hypothetical protein